MASSTASPTRARSPIAMGVEVRFLPAFELRKAEAVERAVCVDPDDQRIAQGSHRRDDGLGHRGLGKLFDVRLGLVAYAEQI